MATVNLIATLLLDAEGTPEVSRAGLLTTVEQASSNCAKALKSSHLWDASLYTERRTFASLGEITADRISGCSAEEAGSRIEAGTRNRLY